MPTRKNVLDNDHVLTVTGGTNYYPFHPDNDDIDAISDLLKIFGEGTLLSGQPANHEGRSFPYHSQP